jgi:hypothetical protein
LLPELRAQRCRGNSTQPRHGRQADDNNYWEPAKNTPLQSRIGSRPHITLYGDGWGEGFGAWGLACYHDQRGAGVGSGPVASLPHMEPSRCPAGDGSGDTSVALELAPATHVGGQRPAPTGRMPGESPATAMHRLELAPHVWRLRGLKLREQQL